MNAIPYSKMKKILVFTTALVCLSLGGSLFAAGSYTIGNMATSITSSFSSLTLLVTGGCYLAGLAFSVTAIMKFKQHKDNPTQVTIGAPVSMVFIAAALLFLPSILSMAGYTMFGRSGGETSGPSGAVFSTGGGLGG